MIRNTFEVDVHCTMTCTDLVTMEGKEGCVLYVLIFHALVSLMYSLSLSPLLFPNAFLLYLTYHALAVIHVYSFFSISFFPSLHSSSPLFLSLCLCPTEGNLSATGPFLSFSVLGLGSEVLLAHAKDGSKIQ